MTRDKILETAYELAEANGFTSLTRDGVAVAAGVAQGTVNHHFNSMAELRDEVMRSAVERANLAIIRTGLVMNNQIALTASEVVKRKALTDLL